MVHWKVKGYGESAAHSEDYMKIFTKVIQSSIYHP
jgi:hypothetical protein